MRRGAALRLVLLDWPGEWRPVFFRAPFFRTSAFCAPPFRGSAFFGSALVLCPHAPTRTHELSRVPKGSHLTPLARI